MASDLPMKFSIASFASSLYNNIVQSQKGKLENVFISPLSIYTAFMMTLAGADGETHQEMVRALQLPRHLCVDVPHEPIAKLLLSFFKPTEGVTLSLGNALFVLQQATIGGEFKQTLADCYKAQVEMLTHVTDLEAKRKHINGWVTEKTMQKIKELIPPGSISSDTVLDIVNALYFKGAWKNPFEKTSTRPGVFHCQDGSTAQVQMMYQKQDFLYWPLDDVDAQAVRLPFKGTNWEMLIVLPNTKDGLPAVLKHFGDLGNLSALLREQFQEEEIQLHMPRFKLEGQGVDMKKMLMECGMRSVFDASADLSKMCSDHRLFVSNVDHKAILEVDEEGATAAAATNVGISLMCFRPTMEFRMDHPFFVALVCDKMVPAFVGHVVQLD